MRPLMFAIAVALVCTAPASLAQPSGQLQDNPSQDDRSDDTGARATANRYSFNRVDDGFLRLDNQTGQISFCSPHTVGWACEAVPEDRAALEKEIGRLQDEVASLKRQIATLREPPPRPPAPLTPPSDKNGDGGLKMPNREDIDRARTAVENAWRRLVEMLTNLQRDLTHKESADGRLSL